MSDTSNGYEDVAAEFMAARSAIGVRTVCKWASHLPVGSRVLDIGAGSGVPLTQALFEAGFHLSAIEPSPRLAAAFAQNFPQIALSRAPWRDSEFLEQAYEGVMAIGLIFLFEEEEQRAFIGQVSKALTPNGRFLFSVPERPCVWEDVLTGQISRSLGAAAYRVALSDCEMDVKSEYTDSGGNFYLDAQKR